VRRHDTIALILVALFAPVSVSAQAANLACEPTTVRSLPDLGSFDPSSLVGQYTLTLVATTGSRAGQQTEGAATLVRSDSSDRGRAENGNVAVPSRLGDTLQPLYGWADVSLSDIGAISERDPRARDPLYPGVLVYVFPPPLSNHGRAKIDIQLGHGSRDSAMITVQHVDGPITVLYAEAIDKTGVFGTWSSGSLTHAGDGHFCLRRASR
jgi:hypothetical protein